MFALAGRVLVMPGKLQAVMVNGLDVVMDRCVKIEYARLFGGLNYAGVNTRIISAKRPPCPPLMG